MSVLIGDIRAELEAKLRDSLANIMAKKAAEGKDNYYILVYASWANGNELHTRIILLNDEPPPMLGTCCYLVRNGILHKVFILPRDNYLISDKCRDEDSICREIESGARKLRMPLVN